MADVTGPISSMPGALHEVPEGMPCDNHPNRLATVRVQGETDSMGCEMVDLCDECAAADRAERIADREEAAKGECDWCRSEATDLRNRRDYDEGMSGPVYRVCGACAKHSDDRIAQEAAYYDDGYEDYDGDDYDSGDECGRWVDGKLGQQCTLAGTEFCDWECPHG